MIRFSVALFMPLLLVGQAMAQDRPAAEKVANAKPGEVRMLVSTGLKSSLDTVRVDAEKAAGRPLVIEYGASKALRAQIEGGQTFEVTVLTPDVINDMIAKG